MNFWVPDQGSPSPARSRKAYVYVIVSPLNLNGNWGKTTQAKYREGRRILLGAQVDSMGGYAVGEWKELGSKATTKSGGLGIDEDHTDLTVSA